MKSMKIAGAVLLALALLSLGALAVSASGPGGDTPTVAMFLDNQTHTIPASSDTWYKFDYVVTDESSLPVTTIVLPNGNVSGVAFEVWTAQEASDTADNTPIGRGTAASIDCDTGQPSAAGQCKSNDLTWSGAFGGAGTYYVHVINNNASPTAEALNISGSGVALGANVPTVAQAQPTAPVPAAAPALSATTTNMDDPNKAAVLDNQQHSIPAGQAVWYSFQYNLNDDGTHPVKTITLANGENNGVSFQVWTQDEMQGGWWNNSPIGQGTAAAVDCSTGELGGAADCKAPDLTWSGAFGAPGTYFVRVINGNSAPANVALSIQ